jgi:hypothetical protein
MLRVSCAFAAVLVCVLASSASAQTIYMPVQVQHGTDMKYYYGGSNPDMADYADRVACRNGYPSARTGNFYSSLYCTIGQIGENRLILSDCLPYRNAAVYGYREHDAVNEAYAAMPRYYRKSDQTLSAIPAGDGTMIVPATPPTGDQHHGMNADQNVMKPASGEIKPRAIIILPKKAPQRDNDAKAVNYVASAK